MPAMSVSRPRRRSLVTLGFFAAFAVAAFTAIWLFDYFVVDADRHTGSGPFRQLLDYDAETMQNALGSLSQVIAAVLGIAITVVSIVVQLAATRYTSRVADLFFRDRINLGVMGFFVVACVEALWVSFTVRRDYVPQATITGLGAEPAIEILDDDERLNRVVSIQHWGIRHLGDPADEPLRRQFAEWLVAGHFDLERGRLDG